MCRVCCTKSSLVGILVRDAVDITKKTSRLLSVMCAAEAGWLLLQDAGVGCMSVITPLQLRDRSSYSVKRQAGGAEGGREARME